MRHRRTHLKQGFVIYLHIYKYICSMQPIIDVNENQKTPSIEESKGRKDIDVITTRAFHNIRNLPYEG